MKIIRRPYKTQRLDAFVRNTDTITRDDLDKIGYKGSMNRTIKYCAIRTNTIITQIDENTWDIQPNLNPVPKIKVVRKDVRRKPLSELIRCTACKKNYICSEAIRKGGGECRSCSSKRTLPLKINFLNARKALSISRSTKTRK